MQQNVKNAQTLIFFRFTSVRYFFVTTKEKEKIQTGGSVTADKQTTVHFWSGQAKGLKLVVVLSLKQIWTGLGFPD